MPKEQPLIRRLWGDAGAAILIGAIIAFLLASLAATGIITIVLAIILLAIAWLLAAAITGLADFEWLPSGKPRYIFLGVLGIIFIFVGTLEWVFFKPPLNATDIAKEVVKNLSVLPSKPETGNIKDSEPGRQIDSKDDHADRITVDATVEQLSRIYSDHTQLQADNIAATYTGKWIKVSGKVYDIQKSIGGDNSYDVSIKIPPPTYVVFLSFDQTKKSQLALFARDDQLTAICQIEKIEPSRPHLSNCELLGMPVKK